VRKPFFFDFLSLIMDDNVRITRPFSRINISKLLISLSIVHLLTYFVPVSIFLYSQGRYPRQLSESTKFVLESSGQDPTMLTYFLMCFFVFSTFIILRELLLRQIDKNGILPYSRIEIVLAIFIITPIGLEIHRLLMGIESDSYELFIFLMLVLFVFVNLICVAWNTWKRNLFNESLSDSALPIFSISMACYLLAAVTNIERMELFGILMSEIHTIFAVMAFTLFYPLLNSLRSSSRISLFCLILSTISIFGFNFVPQVNDSPTITPHLMFEFFGVGFLYCSLLTRDLGVLPEEGTNESE
jgi:hypothetical protein